MKITKPIRQIKRCISLLDHFDKPVQHSLTLGEQNDDPPAIMLTRCIAFGRNTLTGMLSLIEGDSCSWVCLPSICRPYFELSNKLLWASRRTDGWLRLQVDAADQELKLVRDLTALPSFAILAETKSSKLSRFIESTRSEGAQQLPAFNLILDEIEKRDRDCGLTDGSDRNALFQYACLYRIMSGTVHGNVVSIAKQPEYHLTIGVNAAIMGTFAALRATCVIFCESDSHRKSSVEQIAEKVMTVMRDQDAFTLADLNITVAD